MHPLRASPPPKLETTPLFYNRMSFNDPTHKRHKSPFKHSKSFYVFTSGRVIVTVQIHSRKKLLKGLKWPLQNGPLILERSKDLCYPAARFNEKGCLLVWDGDVLTFLSCIFPTTYSQPRGDFCIICTPIYLSLLYSTMAI
jgi:hypothetical protein